MKLKLYSIAALLVAGLLIANSANAQWTRNAGTGKTYLTNINDKVGVGTTNPINEIDVQATGAARIGIKANGGTGAFLFMDKHLATDNATVSYRTNAIAQWQTGTFGNNDFAIANPPFGSKKAITILSGNNYVGIGTATPAATLSVANTTLGGIATTGSFQIGESNTSNLVLDDNEVQARYNGAASTLFLQYWAGDINICASGGTAHFNGNVGIGTVATHKLDVYGQTHVFADDASGNYLSAPFKIENSATSVYISSLAIYNGYTANYVSLFGSGDGLLVYSDAGYLPVAASAFNVNSDITLKKDIDHVTTANYEKYLNQIRNIDAITYRYKDEVATTGEKNGHNKLREELHVGFSAQSLPKEVQTKLPATPTNNAEMKLGYNLSDMAGLTLIGIKALDAKTDALVKENDVLKKENAELKSRMDAFEKALSQCCSNFVPSNDKQSTGNVIDFARLDQNQPNPFNQSSVIKFYIPTTFRTAELVITDLAGVQLKSINITQSGVGQVTINAFELASGSYLYSLFIDNAKVDTRKMELTK